MKKLRNISALGYIDLPLIGRQGPIDDEAGTGCLIPGEVFAVTDEQAGESPSYDDEGDFDPGHGLLAQIDNFVLADANDPLEGMTVPQLKKYAEENDIDLGGATKKAKILAAIRKG